MRKKPEPNSITKKYSIFKLVSLLAIFLIFIWGITLLNFAQESAKKSQETEKTGVYAFGYDIL